MAGVRYFNIKQSRENHSRYPKYSAYMWGDNTKLSMRDMMRDASRWMDGIFMFSTFFWSIFIRTLFISKYSLKDMIYTRYTHILGFQKNREKGKRVLYRARVSHSGWHAGPGRADEDADWSRWARTFLTGQRASPKGWRMGPSCQFRKRDKKCEAFA
jgi:hypothetical protein